MLPFLPLAQNPSLGRGLSSIIYYLIQNTSSNKALVFVNLQVVIGWLYLKIESTPKWVPLTLEVSMWWLVRLWPQIFLLSFSTVFCWVLPAEVNCKDYFLLMYWLHFSMYIGHMLPVTWLKSSQDRWTNARVRSLVKLLLWRLILYFTWDLTSLL